MCEGAQLNANTHTHTCVTNVILFDCCVKLPCCVTGVVVITSSIVHNLNIAIGYCFDLGKLKYH